MRRSLFGGVLNAPKGDPFLGNQKQYKCMVVLGDFPCNNALFGLVV